MRRCRNDNIAASADFNTCTPSSIVGSFTALPLYRFTHQASYKTIQFSPISCFVALEEEVQWSGIANTGFIKIVDGHVTKRPQVWGKSRQISRSAC
jgi:hypothetical protein